MYPGYPSLQKSCAVQHMAAAACICHGLGGPNVPKHRFFGQRDSSFMAMLLPCPFSYKMGDGSTKAEAASDRFALLLRAALGRGGGKV